VGGEFAASSAGVIDSEFVGLEHGLTAIVKLDVVSRSWRATVNSPEETSAVTDTPSEVVPAIVDFQAAVPHLSPAMG
jgi:hypothetical protein